MAYLRPGVYVEEIASSATPIGNSVATSVAAFIGTASKGPTTATLVTSWTQYTTLYGSWGTDNNLTTAVYLFFANGGGQCYVTRVVKSAVASSITLNDQAGTPAATLKLSAKYVGSYGNSLKVQVVASQVSSSYFTIVVYSGGSTSANIVETFTDVTMNVADARYAVSVINGTSGYLFAEDSNASDEWSSTDNPAAASAADLTSGSDGTAPSATEVVAGVTAFDSVENALLLNAPGIVDDTAVDALLTYASGRQDVFVVIDGKDDTVANQLTAASGYGSSSTAGYGAVYYPRITIPNPQFAATGATITVAPGAAVMGQIVSTDASRGVFKSPAGLETRLSGVVSVAKLTSSELDSLNSAVAPVNAIRYIPGSGIVVMGARTLKPGANYRYISTRRSLIFLRKNLEEITKFALFEPNDFRLWGKIESTVYGSLVNFWQQGGLVGASPSDAFFVKCDSENNTDLTVANGQVIVEVGVALQRPAEFIIIRISQYDGGAVVSIS